jgi:Family of unknown function (DUF6599)
MGVFFLWITAWLLAPVPGFCAKEVKMTDRLGWPSEIAGWNWDQEDKTYTPKTLFQYIDGAAEVYLAYRVQRVSVRRYLKPGQPDIVAEVYQMASSEDAFGVFSLELQDPEAGIGQGSEFGGSLLRFWKGRFFATVLGEGTGKEMEGAVLSLGRVLAAGIKETGEPPRLLRCLPDPPMFPAADRHCFIRSHVLLNRCFFISHQNILRLGSDVQAVLARYPWGKKKTHLLLVGYPTEARSQAALRGFRSAYLPEAAQGGSVLTEDGSWTRAERYRRFVVIVFGAPSKSDAERMVQASLTKLKETFL